MKTINHNGYTYTVLFSECALYGIRSITLCAVFLHGYTGENILELLTHSEQLNLLQLIGA